VFRYHDASLGDFEGVLSSCRNILVQPYCEQLDNSIKSAWGRVMSFSPRSILSIFIGTVSLLGCGLPYEHVQDPGALVPVASVMKSIRCEIVTFLVANRLRQRQFLKEYESNFQDAFQKYAYLNLDDKEYGAVQADLKTIDTLGLSLGIDRKFMYGSTNQFSKTWHLGPSVTGTWTYTRSDVFALAQDATLGPTTRTGSAHKPIANVKRQDANFFCYKNAADSSALTNSLVGAEAMVNHERPKLENFERIWVIQVGEITLSKWLEMMSTEMAKNYLAQGPFKESLIPGQINYTFTLEIKPSFDGKYTLVSQLYNPYVPDLTVTKDDTSTFSFYLNTDSAKAAYGAKNGSASIPSSPPQWSLKSVVIPAPPSGQPSGTKPSRTRRNAPGQTPGVVFPAPIALPGPPPAGQ